MIHYLRYCCAMLFALFSFLLATRLSAQAQTREAYVAQSADKTTLTFYYDALRATRTGTTWGIGEMQQERERTYQQERERTYPAWAGTWKVINNTTTRVVFDASFRDFRPTTTAAWFYHCKALTKIEGLEYLNTAEVKDMRGMFAACEALTSLDLKSFKTKNVTDMGFMFAACEALTSIDLRNFDTQNVTDMSWMFKDCSALTSLDLKNFNTQNVTNMGSMFDGCWELTSLDLKNLNTQNVTDMRRMFIGCSGLIFLNLSHFNTQKVTNMDWMFYGCSALTTINSNTAWQCPESYRMFDNCTKLKGAVAYDKYKTDATMANPETGYFTVKPTAVESVRFGADSAQHIYTLQGKRVRGEWTHLPAGVYVVNGKKTVKP